jgi:hypothetical protein
MSNPRTELHTEVVDALVKTKAVNFDAIGSVLSKFGARAAQTGDPIGVIINWRLIDICIPVDFFDLLHGVTFDRAVGPQVKR